MIQKKDILQKDVFRKRGGVPRGYFSDLQGRLAAIPDASPRRLVWREAVGPYAALAACFALLVAVGSFLVDRTSDYGDFVSYEDMMLADMVPHTDPFLESYESYESETFSAEELIDYLIENNYRPEEDDNY